MTQFTDLGLAEPILRALDGEGYTTPTPIQTKTIPVMLARRDIVGIAQTGTGKTAAFVLPLLAGVAEAGERPGKKNCHALILAPTRELAAQIADKVRAYGKHIRPSVAVIVGGVKPGPQVRAMAHGVDIIIATPGRLEDHMRNGAIRLDRTRTVVLDEADQMLDLGFMPAIRRILGKIPAERQTVLLSATMPKQIRALAQDFLNNPEEISVAPAARPIERIEQQVMMIEASAKRDALVGLLSGTDIERAIVFTRTKRGADKVSRHLDTVGLTTAAIHGNKSQGQRDRALKAFRAGKIRVLVATDIAARGIDIDDVSHVVNFELPNVPEAYVHRIGRTARAGKSGIAVSLCDPTERRLLRDIERLIGRRIGGNGEPVASDAASEPARQKPGRRGPAEPEARRRNKKSNPHHNAQGAKSPRRRRPRPQRAQASAATA